MQVGVLPAAPLPGGVKVARRFVKPFVLVRVQAWQPFSFASRSSKAEHPADNRQTQEHYLPGRPAFAKAMAGRPGPELRI